MGIADTGSTDSLSALISLVSDPAKFAARKAELDEATRQLDERIALAGPANEILSLRDELQARKDAQDAQDSAAAVARNAILQQAKDTADKLLSDAKSQSDAITSAANDAAKKANAAAADATSKADAAMAASDALEAKKAALDARQAQLEALTQQLKDQQSRLDSRAQAISDFLASHTEALARI